MPMPPYKTLMHNTWKRLPRLVTSRAKASRRSDPNDSTQANSGAKQAPTSKSLRLRPRLAPAS